jgi:threonine synthase
LTKFVPLWQRSYSSQWRDSSIAPTVRVGDALVMELFHGPTFAFKDVALQFLGNLFEVRAHTSMVFCRRAA